jgi:hypothetical protein
MEVRAGRVAGAPYFSNLLAFSYRVPDLYVVHLHMCVERLEAVAVVYDDCPPVA